MTDPIVYEIKPPLKHKKTSFRFPNQPPCKCCRVESNQLAITEYNSKSTAMQMLCIG
uniref:Uncharacterized protein n=1 Tax=Oryza brachyantha TaxID=4533 RepID=J3MJN0_ORYBR